MGTLKLSFFVFFFFWYTIFCRLEANAGPLANYEVLNFLKSKGASKDPTRVLADVAPSEYKVKFCLSLDISLLRIN